MSFEKVAAHPGLPLFTLEVGAGEQAAQVGVTDRITHQKDEMAVVVEGDLAADVRLDTGGAGGFVEADNTVEAVVISDGEMRVAELYGAGDQFLGVRGTVEERKIGMAVEFGVHGSGVRFVQCVIPDRSHVRLSYRVVVLSCTSGSRPSPG